MSKRFIGVILAVIIIFIGVYALTSNKNTGSSGSPTNHVEGQGTSGVTLVEYGDFQCPYCGQYYPIVKQVESDFNNQITFQFRNFPLVSLHPNAFAGARAAEAAGLMGKYWQMHDLLYEENDVYYNSNEATSTWINSNDPLTQFDQYAQQLGLNVTTFNQDYNSNKVNNLITADESAGNKLGVDATPSFFLDGKQIQVSESVTAFETLIKAAIAQKAGNTSASTPANTGTTSQTKK